MIVSTVLDVLQLDDGATIEAVKGKLTTVYKRTEGPKWTVQNGELSDGKNTVRITFWNHDDLSKMKGKLIYISSGLSSKGELKGIQFAIGEYKNQPQPEVIVREQATIDLAPPGGATAPAQHGGKSEADFDPQEQPENPPAESRAERTPPKQTAPPTPTGPVTLADIDPDARRFAIQLANLRVVAERMADYAIDCYLENFVATNEKPEPRQFTDEQASHIATGIHMEMIKSGFVHNMPTKKITLPVKKVAPPPQKPTPPPEPAPEV